MKFKLDENLPVELASDLCGIGHDVDTVSDEGLRGASDPAVVDTAFAADRILLTLDKGIANLQRYPVHHMRESSCFDRTRRDEGPSSHLCASACRKCSKWTSPTD